MTAYKHGDFLVCDCGVAHDAPSPIHIVEWEDPDPSPRAGSFAEMVSAWIEAIDVERSLSWWSGGLRGARQSVPGRSA